MTKFNFSDKLEKYEDKPDTKSSGWWKAANGDNRVRLLSIPAEMAEHTKYAEGWKDGMYTGICIGKDDKCPGCEQKLKANVKHLFWVIDRKDNQIKLAKLTYSVYKKVAKLQSEPDYAFSEMPMPYDINIKYDSEASPANKYDVVPARSNTPVTEAEAKEFENQNDPEVIVDKMKEKKIKELGGASEMKPAISAEEYPVNDDSNEVPF